MFSMKSISASKAKQNFGELLKFSQEHPVAILRHGKTVAYMVSVGQFPADDPMAAKKYARLQQMALEKDRLVRHQAIAIRLLSSPEPEVELLIQDVRKIVDRWDAPERPMCSHHYIDLWRELLSLPVAEMAKSMCEDFKGWGNALRQNSPFNGVM